MLSVQNAPRTPAERHYSALAFIPSSDASTKLDRLLAAFDALVCCDDHKRLWWEWVLSGRLGADLPAALERLVVELAMQHGETGQ